MHHTTELKNIINTQFSGMYIMFYFFTSCGLVVYLQMAPNMEILPMKKEWYFTVIFLCLSSGEVKTKFLAYLKRLA